MRQALRGPGGRSLDQKPRERWEWDQVNTFYLHRIEKTWKTYLTRKEFRA